MTLLATARNLYNSDFSEERVAFIQKRLDGWCADLGYRDSTVNMLTLSRTLRIPKEELSMFFDLCMKSTFSYESDTFLIESRGSADNLFHISSYESLKWFCDYVNGISGNKQIYIQNEGNNMLNVDHLRL